MWIIFEICFNNAPVKLLCPHPPTPRGQKKYACDKKGRGTRKKDWFWWLYRAGQVKIKGIRTPGQQQQKVMSPGPPGGDGDRTTWPAHYVRNPINYIRVRKNKFSIFASLWARLMWSPTTTSKFGKVFSWWNFDKLKMLCFKNWHVLTKIEWKLYLYSKQNKNEKITVFAKIIKFSWFSKNSNFGPSLS